MGLLRRLGLLVAALVVTASNSLAQEVDDPWFSSLGVGYFFMEGDEEWKGGVLTELRTGYSFDKYWSLEGGVGYVPDMDSRTFTDGRFEAEGDSNLIVFQIDALYHFNGTAGDKEWDPYVSLGGVYLYHSEVSEHGSADPYLAGGFGTFYNLDNDWFLRGDYHVLMVGQDTEVNHQVLASVGYRFGGDKDRIGTGGGEEGGLFDSKGEIARLETIYFPFDSSALTPEARAKLQRNADWLKSKPNTAVTVEGHCDERGTNEYNYALGARRANAAKDYLNKLGVESNRVSTVSFGEDKPAVEGRGEAVWSKNRRAEFSVRNK